MTDNKCGINQSITEIYKAHINFRPAQIIFTRMARAAPLFLATLSASNWLVSRPTEHTPVLVSIHWCSFRASQSGLSQLASLAFSNFGAIYLFIYFISFNVIQPMWLCRQIQTHKIADMSERRKQANKQKKTKQHT
jgi:hypothetical protein